MNIFSNRQSLQEVPPELQPYYHETRDRTRIFGFVGGILFLLLAIGLLLFFLSWRNHRTTVTKNPLTSQSQPLKLSVQPPKTSTNSGTSSTMPSSTSQSSSASSGTIGTAASTTLPNTGPGQVVVLFAATAAVSIVGYQVRLHRKTATI